MMLLDPVNSVTSVAFYRKVAAQSVGRSFLYLLYLAVLFSSAATVALRVRLGPLIDETFVWLEREMPPLTFAAGKITAPEPGPKTLRHPKYPEIAFTIDTARQDPVTPQMLEDLKVSAYLTGTTLYVLQQPGRLEPHDFSRSAAGAKPVVINADFYRNASLILGRVLYPAALVLTFLFFLLWKTTAALVYSLLALMINAVAEGGLSYAPLFNISVHAQTLLIVLQAIFLFMPVAMPLSTLVAFASTGVYIWLAVKTNRTPAAAPA